MTTGTFRTIPLSDITIIRETRQRRTLSNIDNLADSISRLGLIQPIVVTPDLILVAGERRITACKALGWDSIPAQLTTDLDSTTLHLIELEENIKREDLTWQEQHDAMMEYYRLRRESEPQISMEKVAEAIGVTRPSIVQHVLVDRYRSNPMVANAEGFATARNVAQRLHERARADEGITQPLTGNVYTSEVLTGNFHEWVQTYSGPKFNIIHCDFPYGINQQTSGQAAVKTLGAYDDSPDVYWELLRTLTLELDRFCAPSAHMIFWLSTNIEIMSRTWELLKLLDGFKFDEVPLIWMKSDGKGIAPDTNRRFRRVYEVAFFGWRGDRKLRNLKDNSISAPTERERHPHEKSEVALSHFLSGIVDGNSRLFDPTCGSGSALRAGKSLGAAVFGIERDAEFAEIARRSLTGTGKNPRQLQE